MNYRKIMLTTHKANQNIEHRFRKFQKSKLPRVVLTKPKMVMKLVKVEEEYDEQPDID